MDNTIHHKILKNLIFKQTQKQLLLIVFIILISGNIFGQTSGDTVYNSVNLVPRLGINVQKGYGIEIGLFQNKFHTRYPTAQSIYFMPYASYGFYLSSEICFDDLNKIVVGPKIGWELGVIGETHGSYFGAELINYTDFDHNSPAILLKIGVPMLWLNISYGYTMYLDNALKDRIGKHRIAITYTINTKANKEFNRLYKQFRQNKKNVINTYQKH